jgi:hypothetical protein
MPNWFWIVFPLVGIVSYFLIIKLQNVSRWIAALVGIAETILSYFLSKTVFEMRIHPSEIKVSSYVIAVACGAFMYALFLIRGKTEKQV